MCNVFDFRIDAGNRARSCLVVGGFFFVGAEGAATATAVTNNATVAKTNAFHTILLRAVLFTVFPPLLPPTTSIHGNATYPSKTPLPLPFASLHSRPRLSTSQRTCRLT